MVVPPDAAVVPAMPPVSELVEDPPAAGAVVCVKLVVWPEATGVPVSVAVLPLGCDEPQPARAKHVMIATIGGQRLIASSIDRSASPSWVAVAIAILTTYLSDYRIPLYRLLSQRHDIEVLCYGGGERYVPPWFADLDAQLATADFPARRLAGGPREALELGRRYDAVVAPFAGGAMLPAAYAGAHRHGRPFVFWASIWHQPRSLTHAVALPVTRRIFRGSDAVLAYGEHVRRFVASIRGRDCDVFVAPQSVEPELFRRTVTADEQAAFRETHALGDGPLVLYAGRLVPEKGVDVIAAAWPSVDADATLVVVGDGPLAARVAALPRARALGALPRPELPAAYAASAFALLPSVPTPRFKEPWGLVCNEAFEQGRPMIATTAVGAVAGGLVRDDVTGLVVAPGDAPALARSIDLALRDRALRERLGAAAHAAVQPYTYEAMASAFDQALAAAGADRAAAGAG